MRNCTVHHQADGSIRSAAAPGASAKKSRSRHLLDFSEGCVPNSTDECRFSLVGYVPRRQTDCRADEHEAWIPCA